MSHNSDVRPRHIVFTSVSVAVLVYRVTFFKMLLVLKERFLDLNFSDDCCCFVNCAARWTKQGLWKTLRFLLYGCDRPHKNKDRRRRF